MQILEDPTLIFRKRKGTTNKGSEYENLILAKIILSLISDGTVKDFRVWSNDEKFGLFDDIILEIELVSGKIDKYAIQVKYSNDGRILTKNCLTEQKGNFSIKKYRKDFKESKICGYKAVLYTNRKFSISGEFKCHQNIEIDGFNLTIEQIEDNRLNSGSCFKFVSHPPDVFFDSFILFTNQTDVDDNRKIIEEYFHQIFNCRDYSFKKYIDFITEWSSLEGKKVKLCKRLVQHKITLILLSELIHSLVINGNNITLHKELLRNLIMKCPTISFTKSAEEVLVTLWSDLELESTRPTLSKLSRLYQIPMENPSVLLWLMGKCPLMVPQNRVLLTAINLSPDLNFVILDDFKATKLSQLGNKLTDDILTTFKCSIQGKDNISLKNLISGGQLVEHFTTDDLVKMTDSIWCVGKEEKLPFPHISRSLTRHIFDWKVLDGINFGLGTEGLILISNYRKCKHMKYNTLNSEDFYSVKEENWEFCNGKVIFVTDGEYTRKQFDEICELNKGKREFYQFRLKGDYLELVRSKGDISGYKLFRHCYQDDISQCSYVTESDLMCYQYDNRIDIICAGPGMGKTTVMKSIKNNSSPGGWTVLIYVRNHCGYFKNKKTFIERILSETDKSIRRLVEILIRENRVEYMWDGLDEVSLDNVSNILDLIEELARTGAKQWITSRHNLKRLLETRFDVLSRTLIEFNEFDQQRYIEQRLQCSEDDVGAIFEKLKRNIQLFPNNDILGIPLQIYLLTELIHRDQTTYENLIEKVLSIADLYEHFVDEKFNIYCTEKENVTRGNDIFNERNAAFKQQQIELYERVAAENFDFVDTSVKLSINRDRIGIVDVRENNVPEFIHTSFAEYFAACFLAKNRDVVVMLSDFLSDDKYNNVRFFFDLLLAKDCPAHVAVIYKNVELFLKYSELEFSRRDRGGRNLLHLLCSWSKKLEYGDVVETKNGYSIFGLPPSYKDDVPFSETFFWYLSKIYDTAATDDLFGYTALDYAYKSRCLMLYIKLLQREVNFEEFDDVKKICSLICCCVVSDFADVFRIVKNIPYIEVVEGSRFGNLTELAASHNSVKCLKYLANQYYEDIPNFTKTLCQFGYSDSVKYFIDNYSHIDLNRIALTAMEKEHGDILEYLIRDKCVDVNLCDDYWHGGTLLYISSKLGLVSNVRLLIHYKADLNARHSTGRTPLHVAQTSDIVKILLESDADVNVADNFDNTPLHMAASKKSDIVKSLLEYQANVNCQNKRGQTALHIACQEGKVKIVKLLLRNGANVNCATDDGNFPIHTACQSKNIVVFQLLVDNGADINATNKFGEKAIHLSCEEGCFDIVCFLVKKGAHVNSITTYNGTPLEMAREHKISQFLKSNGAKTYSYLQFLSN